MKIPNDLMVVRSFAFFPLTKKNARTRNGSRRSAPYIEQKIRARSRERYIAVQRRSASAATLFAYKRDGARNFPFSMAGNFSCSSAIRSVTAATSGTIFSTSLARFAFFTSSLVVA